VPRTAFEHLPADVQRRFGEVWKLGIVHGTPILSQSELEILDIVICFVLRRAREVLPSTKVVAHVQDLFETYIAAASDAVEWEEAQAKTNGSEPTT
jgi:hypothetical protein